MRRVGQGETLHVDAVGPGGEGDFHRVVAERRERHASLRAENVDAVVAGVGRERPVRRARNAAHLEGHGHRVFDVARRSQVGRASGDAAERADQKIEDVERMRSQVQQQPSARLLGAKAPRQRRWVEASMMGGGVAVRDAGHRADAPRRDGVARRAKARECPPVVGDEKGDLRELERRRHRKAFGVIAGHGLLDVGGLAGATRSKGVLEVRPRRRRNVNRVDFGVGHKRIGIVVKPRHAVPACKVRCPRPIAPHHRNERAAGRFLKCRPALALTHVSAADDAPANGHDGPRSLLSPARLSIQPQRGMAPVEPRGPSPTPTCLPRRSVRVDDDRARRWNDHGHDVAVLG